MSVFGAVLLTPAGSSARGLCPHLGLPSAGLLPIGNEPLVLHQLSALAAAGIRHVVIVCGRRTAFESFTAARRLSHLGMRIDHVDIAVGEAAGVLQAAALLEDHDILIQRGDVLLRDPIGPAIDHASGASPIEAFDIDGSVAVCRVNAATLRAAGISPDSTFEALLGIVGDRARHRAIEGCDLRWCDRTSVLAANRIVLERLESPPRRTSLVDTDSEVQGRVVVGRGARLHRSIVRGPAVIGPGADLSHAFIGPYTAIGADVRVEGAEIEHSIVLPEARIRFLDTRLASSIIGRGACVERRIATPRSLEMMLAGGAEVRLG
jgi:glucose-1-phosphate thymidylyltransferase